MEVDYFDHGSGDLLVIAFTSINSGIVGLKQFEFVRSVGQAEARVLFIKDSSITWYQTGIAGVPGGIEGLAEFLRNARSQHRRCVSLGYSAGAYASMLFSRLVGFDLSIAICPQINITPEFRASIGDVRWQHLLENAYKAGLSKYADLAELYSSPQQGETVIVYGGADRLDSCHLDHLKAGAVMDRIHLIEIEGSDHNSCVVPLRGASTFEKIPSIVGNAYDNAIAEPFLHFLISSIPEVRYRRELTASEQEVG